MISCWLLFLCPIECRSNQQITVGLEAGGEFCGDLASSSYLYSSPVDSLREF